ncbi:MAG: hypothetical protein LBQ57_11280 [Spirochaetales bacterium]|jgi:peptide subunit release factor 1 (eRF1)|nr:hypothetical protein [Spirochaetales bacterium]
MTQVLSQKEVDQLLAAINSCVPTDETAAGKMIEQAMERLHQSIVADIKQVVREAVKEAIAENCKVNRRKK